MDNVVVIAGGAWQVPLVRFLQSKGHAVFVADPFDDSPAVLIADQHIKADVRDEAAIYQAIVDRAIKPRFIVTDQSDISVETANNLAHRFGLKANPQDSVKSYVNKYLSRQFAAKAGTPSPEWRRISTEAELQSAIAAIGLPVILKPPDNQASCGVYKIDKDNLAQAEQFLQMSLDYSRTGYILCEEYVEGVGITVEGFCSNGKHRCFAASAKDHFPSGVIASLIYPTTVPDALLAEIFAANDRYVETSGLQFGITHGEYIVDAARNKFWLVEIACRGGGTLVSSDIAQWVSGVAFYELLYSELCGGSTDVKNLQLQRRGAYLEFFEFGEGLVEDVRGVEAAKAIPGVFELKLSFQKGEQIRLAENGRTRQGCYIVFGADHAQVLATAARVQQTIDVRFADPFRRSQQYHHYHPVTTPVTA